MNKAILICAGAMLGAQIATEVARRGLDAEVITEEEAHERGLEAVTKPIELRHTVAVRQHMDFDPRDLGMINSFSQPRFNGYMGARHNRKRR